MILFFGTRPGKSKTVTLSHATCSYCRQRGTLTASIASNYFHLFWIKLFKISSFKIAECSHCKKVYYQEEFTEEMNRALGWISLPAGEVGSSARIKFKFKYKRKSQIQIQQIYCQIFKQPSLFQIILLLSGFMSLDLPLKLFHFQIITLIHFSHFSL